MIANSVPSENQEVLSKNVLSEHEGGEMIACGGAAIIHGHQVLWDQKPYLQENKKHCVGEIISINQMRSIMR